MAETTEPTVTTVRETFSVAPVEPEPAAPVPTIPEVIEPEGGAYKPPTISVAKPETEEPVHVATEPEKPKYAEAALPHIEDTYYSPVSDAAAEHEVAYHRPEPEGDTRREDPGINYGNSEDTPALPPSVHEPAVMNPKINTALYDTVKEWSDKYMLTGDNLNEETVGLYSSVIDAVTDKKVDKDPFKHFNYYYIYDDRTLDNGMTSNRIILPKKLLFGMIKGAKSIGYTFTKTEEFLNSKMVVPDDSGDINRAIPFNTSKTQTLKNKFVGVQRTNLGITLWDVSYDKMNLFGSDKHIIDIQNNGEAHNALYLGGNGEGVIFEIVSTELNGLNSDSVIVLRHTRNYVNDSAYVNGWKVASAKHTEVYLQALIQNYYRKDIDSSYNDEHNKIKTGYGLKILNGYIIEKDIPSGEEKIYIIS